MNHVAEPIGPDDVVRVHNAIDAMQVSDVSATLRRRAALTVCEVLMRSGESLATLRQILEALDLLEV